MKSAAHISGLLLCRTILLDPFKNALKDLDFLFYCLPDRPVPFQQLIHGAESTFEYTMLQDHFSLYTSPSDYVVFHV